MVECSKKTTGSDYLHVMALVCSLSGPPVQDIPRTCFSCGRERLRSTQLTRAELEEIGKE